MDNNISTYQPNKLLSVFAKMIAYLLHPLFIPVYFVLLLAYYFPYEFSGITDWQLRLKIISTFLLTAFFPAFAVFLLWRLQFSESIFLRTQKERIVPYIITMFFYWWMYYLSRNMKDQPEVLKFFYLGIFFSSIVGLISNNFVKISLHGIAMGSIAAAVILTAFFYQTTFGVPITVVVLLAGTVCSSRLVLKNHTPFEIYAGLSTGIICQLIAYWFAM